MYSSTRSSQQAQQWAKPHFRNTACVLAPLSVPIAAPGLQGEQPLDHGTESVRKAGKIDPQLRGEREREREGEGRETLIGAKRSGERSVLIYDMGGGT